MQLIIADEYNANNLKSDVYNFITNHKKDFINFDFEELIVSHPKVIQPLIKSLVG